ncbi:MAG: S-layer homology domain-containing protein [Bacillota bacterium]|nr:S-layer homology domain-containing protein [Bacillota bacterium]
MINRLRGTGIIFALILTMMMLGCVVSNGLAETQTAYSDLLSNHAVYPYVNYLSGQGIINGYEDGTFRPAAGVSRAEMVALLMRAAKLSSENISGVSAYNDVDAGHWANGAIAAASLVY